MLAAKDIIHAVLCGLGLFVADRLVQELRRIREELSYLRAAATQQLSHTQQLVQLLSWFGSSYLRPSSHGSGSVAVKCPAGVPGCRGGVGYLAARSGAVPRAGTPPPPPGLPPSRRNRSGRNSQTSSPPRDRAA